MENNNAPEFDSLHDDFLDKLLSDMNKSKVSNVGEDEVFERMKSEVDLNELVKAVIEKDHFP
jgi:hypothetical protein